MPIGMLHTETPNATLRFDGTGVPRVHKLVKPKLSTVVVLYVVFCSLDEMETTNRQKTKSIRLWTTPGRCATKL